MQARIEAVLAALRPDNALRVLPWLPRASVPLTVLVTVTGLASAFLPALFVIVSGALIGTVPAAVSGGLDSFAAGRFSDLLLALGALYVVQQVVGPTLTFVSSVLADRVTLNAADEVMRDCLAPPGIAHLEDPSTLDAVGMARGVGSLGWGPGQATRALIGLTFRKIAGLLSLAIVARFNLGLAAVLLAGWSWCRRDIRLEVMRSLQAQIGNVASHRHARYFRGLSFGPKVAKETRLFAMSGWVGERFTGHWQDAMEELRLARSGGVLVNLRIALSNGGLEGAALALLAWSATRGSISLGEFAVYAQAVMAASALTGFGDDDVMLEWASAALPAAEALRKLSSEAAVSGGSADVRRLDQGIRFEQVRFCYPGTTTPVFDGLDLEIPAGKSLAIVGLNGAGKTTLIKLLARLYDPQNGAVRADGIDLRDLDPRQWQQQVGAIFQDFVRFELPARENVGFGAPQLPPDDATLDLIAARAGASSVVDSLPRRWDTVLSRSYEGGHDLSGGQWQKVALARALYAVHGGAQVLVLDEPTANLDVRSEAELFDRFLEVTAGVTTVLVSHRFSTVRHADRICVIESGRVVEQGGHDELLAAGGRYAEMFRLQAARFEVPVMSGEDA